MKVNRKAKFIIFFTIAILALGLSNIAAVLTGDLVSSSLPNYNETEKLIALDDDNFSPTSLNTVYEETKVVEEVNDTDDVNDTNTSTSDSDANNNNQQEIDYSDDDKQSSDSQTTPSGSQSDDYND